MIRRQQFDFRFLTTLSYVYSNGTHITFLSNSVVHAFRCQTGHEFQLHLGRALHDIAFEGLQSAKNTVGG